MAVLAERHDLAHAVEPDGAWNESLYFNTYDDATDVGFFTRIGIRPNEGRVEGACFVWLPGGGTASVSEVGARHEVSDTGFEIGSFLAWKGKTTAFSNSSFHSKAGPMSHLPSAQ